MKLSDHVEYIRQLIDSTVRNRLGRMGVTGSALQCIDSIPEVYRSERSRIELIREVLIAETGAVADAYEKMVEEFTFTLFNRIAALKVIEAHTLHPEIITRRSQHGDRSFAHKHWLEQNPDGRNEEMEGIVHFIEDRLEAQGDEIPLFSLQHPFHFIPTATELNAIINAFNAVEKDEHVEDDIWESDDVLGWLYESYNFQKKEKHDESGLKTEYDKVSIQSQYYTPRWVVKFLVDNALGKMYLEMYPGSIIKNQYKIANAPKIQTRDLRPLTEIKFMDPATGSGNFLLYGFDLFYDLYTDQIENFGADYSENQIPELIITHNLYGIDLDDRAVQLAQLGLYIKAKRKKRTAKIDHFNIVSSDFFLPTYEQVKPIFEENANFDAKEKEIIQDIWSDLQQAYKFGSLIRLEEKLSIRLHGLTQTGVSLFSNLEAANYVQFRNNFFSNLQKAVTQNAARQGQTFLNTKTHDAIVFLQLLTQKYDVVVANPPYTDSADFGPELKIFVDANYKQPYKFNTNLYATFIKRCCELIDEKGKVSLVHPPTFMYIKTFEDVRKFIIEKMHISLFVEWGYLGMFNPTARVDSAMYVLEKEEKEIPTKFIKLNDLYEGKRYEALFEAYDDLLANHPNKHTISLPQKKLKIIDGWPFIYWISDGFREKFRAQVLDKVAAIRAGIQTSYNERFLRFWWENLKSDLSENYNLDKKRWVKYAKGGPLNKWHGNIWLVIDWEKDGQKIQEFLDTKKLDLHAQPYYFLEGLTYSASGSKGISFRHLPINHLFDIGGASVFLIYKYKNLYYLSGLLNSNLTSYIINCLNPTVNVQPVDLKRVPFVNPPSLIEDNISALAEENIKIKKQLCSYSVIETNFVENPLLAYSFASLKDRILAYLNYENEKITQIMLNEAIINQLIFNVYELSDEDRQQVEAKMGKSVGELPVFEAARKTYLSENKIEQEIIKKHIDNLIAEDTEYQQVRELKEEFEALYQSNNDFGEFCFRHKVNPINIWYWFKESKVLPQARTAEIALEFLVDAFRTILMDDEDGIVPLTGLPGEPRLMDRFGDYCISKGFSSAQIMQLDGLIGRPLNEYIEHHFFKNLCNHLNLFMYLPKTPFIWHLTSGEHQGFEAYIIIYKWNRDSLYKLKSNYLSKRAESLQYRLQQIRESTTGQAQSEKETIRLQLLEIDVFAKKIDELIAEGYDPKLDDGVGKNIAQLQKKGMLRAEVLKSTQLQKYLNADW